MQGVRFQNVIHVPGALAANLNIRWTVPFDCALEHISAVASNDSDATLSLGISSDSDSILTATTIGDSGAPATFDRDNWASTNPGGRLLAGETLVITVDYDGVGGTAAQNLTLSLTFSEG
jgi:hypothetical protein